MADPDVTEILYQSLNDDGYYRGFPRDGHCLRCIRLGNDPVRVPKQDWFAFCEQCMEELDMGKRVKLQMFGMRRNTNKS